MTETAKPDGHSWWRLRILFECRVVGASPEQPFCEERVVLVSAESLDHAKRKGAAYGAAERTEYKNDTNEEVVWTFQKVLSVDELDGPPDESGWEIASTFIDCPPPNVSGEGGTLC